MQILASMFKERDRLGLLPEDFYTPILAERLDPLEMPVSWVGDPPNNRSMHLHSHPFLFPPATLVTSFRALNYSAMCKYVESATATGRHVTQTARQNIRSYRHRFPSSICRKILDYSSARTRSVTLAELRSRIS